MRRGFIFATTGPLHTEMARRAAATVAAHHPDIPIDLFTDQTVSDPVFSEIHQLDYQGARPRFEGLERTRFDRTIALDSDLFVVAPIQDVFDVLDRFDIALAHDQRLNIFSHTLVDGDARVPPAFPQFNSGVIAIRRTPAVQRFVGDWRTAFEGSGQRIDQPSLRQTLYESDLRISTLPPQYNLIDPDLARGWDSRTASPRILHSVRIKDHAAAGHPATNPREVYGDDVMDWIADMQRADGTLSRTERGARALSFADRFPGRLIFSQELGMAGHHPAWRVAPWARKLKTKFYRRFLRRD